MAKHSCSEKAQSNQYSIDELTIRARALQHYPLPALSQIGLSVLEKVKTGSLEKVTSELGNLPDELFSRYAELGDPALFEVALSHTAILELNPGCPHQCAPCYIDAPLSKGRFMTWPHVKQLVTRLSAHHQQVLADELVDLLIFDTLEDSLKTPETPLDVVCSVSRHRRNRFNNFSNNIMPYWRSNPTTWSDPLFDFHFGHVAELISNSFQIANPTQLKSRIDGCPAMTARFKEEFGGDFHKLRRALTLSPVLSTIPFAEGSLQHRAVDYIKELNIVDSDGMRITAPHPNLLLTRAKDHERYWSELKFSLRTTEPKLVYLFVTSIDQLYELVSAISEALEFSDRHWWMESRMAKYNIESYRKKGFSDQEIVSKLKSSLKRLSFVGTLEGRARQFEGNPFYAERGTVMCVNGVVLSAAGEMHYQACTSPNGDDLAEGLIHSNIHQLPTEDFSSLVSQYPLVNRARESVTRNLSTVPMNKRRRPTNWFSVERERLQTHPRYSDAKNAVVSLILQCGDTLNLPLSHQPSA